MQSQETSRTPESHGATEESNSSPSKKNPVSPVPRNHSRWSPSEKEKLPGFLRDRENMSWEEKADSYSQISTKRRSAKSIRSQAFQMGIEAHSNSRSGFVVLKVAFPPYQMRSGALDGHTKATDTSIQNRGLPPSRILDDNATVSSRAVSRTHCPNDKLMCSEASFQKNSVRCETMSNIQNADKLRSIQEKHLGHSSAGTFDWILN